jgi:hypothetical protein
MKPAVALLATMSWMGGEPSGTPRIADAGVR